MWCGVLLRVWRVPGGCGGATEHSLHPNSDPQMTWWRVPWQCPGEPSTAYILSTLRINRSRRPHLVAGDCISGPSTWPIWRIVPDATRQRANASRQASLHCLLQYVGASAGRGTKEGPQPGGVVHTGGTILKPSFLVQLASVLLIHKFS